MAKAVQKKRLALKEAGRPAGAPNKGSTFPRDCFSKFRCTQAYRQVIDAIKKQDPAGKLSEADIMHEALQLYAVRKLSSKQDLYWVNRIL